MYSDRVEQMRQNRKEHLRRQWTRELEEHVEVLITVPPGIDGHRMIGEIRGFTDDCIQLHWAAQCTSLLGPVGEHSRFRKIETTEIPFNVYDTPGACGSGTLTYLLPDGRILSLHKPYACFIPPDQVEGLQPDERERMAARYAAYQQRYP